MNVLIRTRDSASAVRRGLRDDLRRILVAVVGVSVVVALAVVAWVWRHPTTLPDAAPVVSLTSDRLQVNESIYIGMTFDGAYRDSGLTLHGAQPNTVSNTAKASVTFGVCTIDTASGQVSISSVNGSIEDDCSDWTVLGEEPVALGAGQQLLMEVTPTKRGAVEIAGADVRYTDGWQTGDQDTGEYLLLDVQ